MTTPKTKTCPNDHVPLVAKTYEADIEVDQCPDCGGIWLDHHELERIEEIHENDYSEEIHRLPDLVGQAYAMALAKSKPPLKCPICDEEMERREHGYCSQILIDVCPHCRGIWLDQGELSALEIFFERVEAETADVRHGFLGGLMHYFR